MPPVDKFTGRIWFAARLAGIGMALALLAAMAASAAASAGTVVDPPQGQHQGPKLEAKVAPYLGRNVFFVNGRPIAPIMYSGTEHSRDTWTGRPRQSLSEFTQLGYEIIQTDLWFKYSLRPDGTFDLGGIRRQLAGILEVNPAAKIVVRINVSAPRWWLERNPAERCRVTAPASARDVFGGNTAESLASRLYASFAEKYLRLFLTELEKTPEGDRVIGFHLGGGVYGEWHYYGIYNEPDASEPMRRRFSEFVSARYGTIERVNVVWKTAYRGLDEIAVPSYEQRYDVGDGDYRDPQRDRQVVDYYECQQLTVGALVNGLARIIKETWSRPTIVGLFYGYFYGGWTVGAQASQADIMTLFASPYVDYFSGPYASRDMRGSGLFRSLVDSVSLHGKVWISEHDGGTHLGNISRSKFPTIPENEEQSLARMRRNFMYCLAEGAGQWWYDFGPDNRSGWWSTPAMMEEARHLLALASAALERPYTKPSDVLVVYDMAAFNHVRPAKADRLTAKITEGLTDSLLGTGVAFDRVFLMDLPKVNLSRYRLVVLGNLFVLNPAQRTHIKERVMKEGRTVVCMAGAGYSDGERNDVALISDLVGMRIEKSDVSDQTVAINLAKHRSSLDAKGLYSRFQVVDRDVTVIGTYSNGAAAAAVKTTGNATVYYFGVPLTASLELLKVLLGQAGARAYIGNTVDRDYVAVGGGMIGIYSVNGGDKRIQPQSGPAVLVTLPPFSARYFDLQSGAQY